MIYKPASYPTPSPTNRRHDSRDGSGSYAPSRSAGEVILGKSFSRGGSTMPLVGMVTDNVVRFLCGS
jgi:hypothetical protein